MDYSKSQDISVSLWDMILEHIAPNEIYEVKSFLGEDLVDQSIELRNEINTLIDIYDAYSKERASGDNDSTCLPEPPELRQRLMLEIQFFVQGIRDQARAQGRNPDHLLDNHRTDIIDYAYDSGSSRPLTSDTSLLSTSRSSYRVTPVSDRINVNLMKEKLNYMAFDDVQANLKQFLKDEVDQLNIDLLEIHNSMYNDDMNRCQSRLTIASQPTISELKKERHDLEQLLLKSSQTLTNRKVNKPSSNNNHVYNKDSKKVLSKVPSDTDHISSLTIKSPPRLKPIDPKSDSSMSPYEESPLDLGLPDTSSSIQDSINSNNSSINNHLPVCNNPLSISFNPNPPIGKPRNFNSAQKFRQKVLQNRKESCDH